MDKGGKNDLDHLLASLARDERAGRPEPGAALIARVLADAADVTAAGDRAATAEPVRPKWRLSWPSLAPLAWPGGAVATMALGLTLGIGIGYGYGDQAVAMTALDGVIAGERGALDDPLDGALWAEGPF
ncbi:MAG: hypothetical protein AAGI70_08995 [Pseudomonadota bacterium]